MNIFTRSLLLVMLFTGRQCLPAQGQQQEAFQPSEKVCNTTSSKNQPQASFQFSVTYIAQNASGGGTSWQDASGDLKAALDAAVPGTEIWVKAGSYYPTTCTDCTFNDRNQFFQIPSDVKLYGGFAGNEASVDERNISAHPTYLSGDIDMDQTPANNSFTILFTKDVSEQTLVDGFIITGGNADQHTAGLGTPPGSGAGWFNLGSTPTGFSHPVVKNCLFENNYSWGYGAGMFNDGSFNGSCSPSLTNCQFRNNISYFGGGAMYNTGSFEGSSNPLLLNCTFENNECEQADGGALFNIGSEGGESSPQIISCTFTGNNAYHDGGALFNFGKGGISSPVITGCIFTGNEGKEGGAIYNDGTFEGYNATQLTDCQFFGNHSFNGDGGAIYNSAYQGTCNPKMINCRFENNNSTFAGGAIFNNGVEGVCNPVITNCRFVANSADTYGGAMYNQGKTGNASPDIANSLFINNSALSAGAIYNLGSDNGNANARITNSTFYGNHANVGGAVYCNAGEQGTGTSSPALGNCIFWANTASDEGDIFRIIWGTPSIRFSLTDKPDCEALYNGNGGHLDCQEGLLFSENPLFENPGAGNFHLTATSPAINQGDNELISQYSITVDLDNLPRIYDGTVDLGAFEFGSTTGGAPVITQQPLSQTACAGEQVQFQISASGNPPMAYQWMKNNDPIPGAITNTLTLPDVSTANAGIYQCMVTDSTDQESFSQTAQLTVNEPATVSLTIAADQEVVCPDEIVTFTASAENAGDMPAFQWFRNGQPYGGSETTLSAQNLNDGDTFTCEVTTSESCVNNATAFSNSVTIHVENSLTAALSIVPDAATPCEGQEITFLAVYTNGGDDPVFEWTVNGDPEGTNSPSFQFIPQHGDQVQCMMTSSENCVDIPTVASETDTVQVLVMQTAAIEITSSEDSTFCLGTEVIFAAEIEHGGVSPVYDWRINDLPAGGNEPVFSTTGLNDQDEVVCLLTSTQQCVEEKTVTSNAIVVSVDSCLVAIHEKSTPPPTVICYPNPSDGKIYIEIYELSGNFVLQLLNAHGQTITTTTVQENPIAPYKRELSVSDFPEGVYYFQIITNHTVTTKRIIVH